MNEDLIQRALAVIASCVNLLLEEKALTPEQLQAEINDMIDPYYTEETP